MLARLGSSGHLNEQSAFAHVCDPPPHFARLPCHFRVHLKLKTLELAAQTARQFIAGNGAQRVSPSGKYGKSEDPQQWYSRTAKAPRR